MSPEFIRKWEDLIDDVDKYNIPLEFTKKIIFKLRGKRQRTINIERLIEQGLNPEQIEEVLTAKMIELEDEIVNVEFLLNVESIAETVQPETDKMLKGL